MADPALDPALFVGVAVRLWTVLFESERAPLGLILEHAPSAMPSIAAGYALVAQASAQRMRTTDFRLTTSEKRQYQDWAAHEYALARAWADVARGADLRTILLDYP